VIKTRSQKKGQTVSVNYVGKFLNGKIFDQSTKPFSFTLGSSQVIKGWDEAIGTMGIGEKALLYISSDYGYGVDGFPPVIPPNSPLLFEVELLLF